MNDEATMQAGDASDPGLRAAAIEAAALVTEGARVGLGSGRASSAFIAALGRRVWAGLSITAVASSEASARLARALAIPLGELDEGHELALTVDGADEVSPDLDLVKGRGGALVRERILAAASARQVILIGPEKLVPALGGRGPIPVEVIPMARGLVARRLHAMGMDPVLRMATTGVGVVAPFVSDNGNLTFDCAVASPLADGRTARALEAAILAIPGVVDTGLFLGTAERVLVGYADGRVEVRVRPGGAAT